MNTNIVGLIASFAFVIAVIAAAFILKRFTRISAEGVRKFIHILVSNWILLLVYFFDDLRFAVIGPIAFIIVNTVFVYSGMGKYLGMGSRKRDNGLIYFPISLLILVLLLYRGVIRDMDIIAAVLTMGYGDGFAALAGMKYGRHKYSVLNSEKSWEGSAVMLAIAFAIAMLTGHTLPASLLMAAAAAFFEGVTPLGLDNITVPIITALAGVLL